MLKPEIIAGSHIYIDVGFKTIGIFPIFGKIRTSGPVGGSFPFKAAEGGKENCIVYCPGSSNMILMKTAVPMRQDDIRFLGPYDIADFVAQFI